MFDPRKKAIHYHFLLKTDKILFAGYANISQIYRIKI